MSDGRVSSRASSSTTGSALFDESALVELLQGVSLGRVDRDGCVDLDLPDPVPAFKCCKTGARSDYVPSVGLEGPGFISGYGHLI
jgi:hypothetical protein